MGWGKLIGGLFGWLLFWPFHLPIIGLVLGIWLGHRLDQAFHGFVFRSAHIFSDRHTHVQHAFFDGTFAVMGYLAKSDGAVSSHEIQVAEQVMQRFQLDEKARARAISAFRRGKASGFDLDAQVQQLRDLCWGQGALLRVFVDIQMQIAQAEGPISAEKMRVLQRICQGLGLGFNTSGFDQGAFYGGAGASGRYRQAGHAQSHSGMSLQAAYDYLDVSSSASDQEVKRAYRKQMGQYHPDRLVAKGLPDEMIKAANEKTAQIKKAYAHIASSRGIET